MSALPGKTIEMHNHHFNSEKWRDFKWRDDDVVVATAYKSGTTWMQNILLKLMYQGKEQPSNSADLCPLYYVCMSVGLKRSDFKS